MVPRGSLELLPDESVAFQLGALYLTNKRVVLLAPGVIRAAFIRDVDAIGTLTERATGWSLFFGIVLLALAVASLYASGAQADLQSSLPALYLVDPRILAGILGVAAIALLAMYFFWTKRTLFVSVSGRPLITVSISDWNQRKLDGMDTLLNTFFEIKDSLDQGTHAQGARL